MINASEAFHIILEHTQLLGTEKVPLLDALGRTLGQDVVAEEDTPPFDNSSMDGFAIVTSDTNDATKEHPSVLQIVGESSAGNVFNGTMRSGQAVHVMTGGMIPKGADSVVPLESVRLLGEDRIECVEASPVGMHIRARGEDIKEGEIVLRDGEVIRPPHFGILAALGITKVQVGRKPLVNILSTGVTFLQFVRPAILAMQGRTDVLPVSGTLPLCKVPLRNPMGSDIIFEEWRPRSRVYCVYERPEHRAREC